MDLSKFHCSGWATRNDLLCADGRTIKRNAFKDNDGSTVPVFWNHDHSKQEAVLGHALLENRDEGVYAYVTFNETENGKHARHLVEHGDIRSFSIYANKLKQIANDVIHGTIRELSLVPAGANPGATIDFVMAHGDEDGESFEANYDESAIMLYHSVEKAEKKVEKEEDSKEDSKEESKEEDNRTIADVVDTMNEEQKTAMYALIAEALESKVSDDDDSDEEESKGGKDDMKHNVFENDEMKTGAALSHSDQASILELAKQSFVGSLQTALKIYAEEHKDTLAHGFDEIEKLFPDFKEVYPGAPELLERDMGWVGAVMKKTHKSPLSRIRTTQADARIAELRAKGYQTKGDQKTLSANIKLLSRTTDPQTIYRKDELNRDDIVDITDFDVVSYQWNVMLHNMQEDLARAIMIGDGREDGDPDKIHEDHIRPIFTDEDLYAIHTEVDFEAVKAELQGTDAGANFGENFIKAEALVNAALYGREKYKGTGTPDYYCTPHALNVMLLARDRNGRRIYDSKADLAAALNVNEIFTAEQFEGATRTTKEGDVKKLLGIFVNLVDYQIGATKGGEITKFDQFDIDFNKHKYLMEARCSGALTKTYSAIVVEEPVNA